MTGYKGFLVSSKCFQDPENPHNLNRNCNSWCLNPILAQKTTPTERVQRFTETLADKYFKTTVSDGWVEAGGGGGCASRDTTAQADNQDNTTRKSVRNWQIRRTEAETSVRDRRARRLLGGRRSRIGHRSGCYQGG